MNKNHSGWRQALASLRARAANTFASFDNRDFRVYSIGQFISLIGTWMQSIALAWVVYEMTRSPMTLGLVSFASTVPVLLLSWFAGGVADRFDRRRIIIITQWLEMAQAGTLAVLTALHLLSVPLVIVLALVLGVCSAFETPARQAFVADLVGKERLASAIGLNSALFNSTRMFGPAVAGVAIATLGDSVCFALNALSYVAAVITLRMITARHRQCVGCEKSPMRQQPLWPVLKSCGVVDVLYLVAAVSIFGFQISVLMPVITDQVLHGKAPELGFLTAAMGIGALLGALTMASQRKIATVRRTSGWSTLALGAGLTATAWAATMHMALAAIAAVGFCISLGLSGANFFVQMSVPEEVKGRVMGVYSFFLIGLAPIGALMSGWLASAFGIQATLMLAASVCALASVVYLRRISALPDRDQGA